jgi:hypothetical protein
MRGAERETLLRSTGPASERRLRAGHGDHRDAAVPTVQLSTDVHSAGRPCTPARMTRPKGDVKLTDHGRTATHNHHCSV